jgi:hypothetical protein
MQPLTPIIDQKFQGAIWRMEIDETSDLIFIEIRENTERQVTFSSINLSTGYIYFKGLVTPERWLTGIEAACDGVLLLHFYEHENGPVHKGLMAIEGQTGNGLWNDFNMSFDFVSINGPIIHDSRRQPPKQMLIDIKTSATKRPYEPSIDTDRLNAVELPYIFTADELPSGMEINNARGLVHYASCNNYRIVSLHALNGERFDQLLLILDEEAPGSYREVFRDLLNTGIQKLQPEAFIIHKNHLVYIKNTSELRVLKL